MQTNRRVIDAEKLGDVLRAAPPAAATVISDGTVEAGALAQQLVIGLGMGGWQAGGDNVKSGDPNFFPDSDLTIEVSATAASPEDHSVEAAKRLVTDLARQNVVATLRYTTLTFPENFMRIKVARR